MRGLCCCGHTILLKMAFQTDVHADIDRQSRFKRYLFSWNSEGLSGCVIIQEVSNWLLEIWSAHYSEHWINDFFTSLTVYRISFTSVMNQFIHPLESRVPLYIFHGKKLKLTPNKKMLIYTSWQSMLTYVIPFVWWPI